MSNNNSELKKFNYSYEKNNKYQYDCQGKCSCNNCGERTEYDIIQRNEYFNRLNTKARQFSYRRNYK